MYMYSNFKLFSEKPLVMERRVCHGDSGEIGHCMFHYECKANKGNVIKTCIDGFLFGVCCQNDDEKKDKDKEEVSEHTD